MANAEINLRDLYVEKYLRPTDTIVEQKEDSSDDVEVVLEAKKKKVKKVAKKDDSNEKVGGEYYTDSTENVFLDIMKIFKEEYGGEGGDMSDDTFDFDDSTGEDDFGGEEETFTISQLRNMSLGELANLLADGGEDEFGGEEDLGVDDIPLESYGFEGDGQHVGAQANYSGKAALLPKTDLVTPDGNIKKEKAKVGAKPQKSTGSEGKHHGAQSTRDGKASKQGKSNLVKDNGDADFGKNKTGYGKAKGEDLY